MNCDDCKTIDYECHLKRIEKWHNTFETGIAQMIEILNNLNESSIKATSECSRHYQKTIDLTKAKTSFTFEISHELKAPLASVYNIINVILDGYLDNDVEKQKEYLNKAKYKIRNIIELLNDLLMFSRLEEQADNLEKTEFNVGEIFDSLKEELNDYAGKSGVEISWDLCEECPRLFGNPVLIRRVYANIIHNAVKYSKRGQRVEVTNKRDDGRFLMRVVDHGIGIKEEELDQIFDIFFRGDTTRRDSVEGLGLGLSLVKRIVDAHEGCIKVDSKWNEGTVMEVRIPVMIKEGN
jgi:two-component system, OmpR family, sensor histidine kinase VicK